MTEPLSKLKTSALSRQLSIAKTTLNIGKNIAKNRVATLFASEEQKQHQKQALMSEQAQYFAQEIGKLKGSVVKVGQMLALYGESFLPPEIISALHHLDDNTAQLDFDTIYSIIRGELGALTDDFDINPIPIGTASLAQVHKAIHKSTGQAVVLKVQYPGIAEAIDSDLSLFRHLLKLTNAIPQTKELDEWFTQIQALLHQEVNYRIECDTTERFFDYLQNDTRFVVPKIYRNYCTDRLICMSFEAGIALTDPKIKQLDPTRKNAIGQAVLELVLQELFVFAEMQTDPNFGNYLLRLHEDKPDQLVLLDFGAIKAFDESLVAIARDLFTAGYHRDKNAMKQAMHNTQYPFFNQMDDDIKEDLADVFLLATEGFANPVLLDSPFVQDGYYDWAQSNLYTRTSNHAKRCMQSVKFSMPPKELMFISRKFIGAWVILSTLNAKTHADTLRMFFVRQ